MGHSLGGSIAVRMAEAAGDFKQRCGGAAEIAGVVAVDVVEGTAIAALADMPEVGGERRCSYYSELFVSLSCGGGERGCRCNILLDNNHLASCCAVLCCAILCCDVLCLLECRFR